VEEGVKVGHEIVTEVDRFSNEILDPFRLLKGFSIGGVLV